MRSDPALESVDALPRFGAARLVSWPASYSLVSLGTACDAAGFNQLMPPGGLTLPLRGSVGKQDRSTRHPVTISERTSAR